jgi:hypothetical protein
LIRCLVEQKRSLGFAIVFGPRTPGRTWGTRPVLKWIFLGDMG